MTGEPGDFIAKLMARRAQTLRELAEAKQRRDITDELIAEAERLEIEYAFFCGSLDTAINWPKHIPVKIDHTGIKYGRRPPTWKGAQGYEFVADILSIQARDNCGDAEAIKTLKRQQPDKYPQKPRELERRFQEIKDYWRRWHQWEAMLDARLKDLQVKSGPH